MKRISLLPVLLGGCVLFFLFLTRPFAAQDSTFQSYEYGTIRWGGRDYTHFIRPNGKIEMLGPILSKAQRGEHVDERSFYMNLALNAVAREGFDLAAMTPDEIVVRRPVAR